MDKSNSEIQVKSIKDSLGTAACYIGNLSELADEVSDVLVEDDGGKIVLDFTGAIRLLQAVWDKLKETASECADREIEVKLPAGLVGQLIAAALTLVGFRL